MMGRATVSAGRMIWVGVGLLTLMVILPYFTFTRYLIIRPFLGFSYFSYFRSCFYFLDSILVLIGYAAVTAYLYGARRLAAASWGRALTEVVGGVAALAAIVLVIAGIFYGFFRSGMILVFLWLSWNSLSPR